MSATQKSMSLQGALGSNPSPQAPVPPTKTVEKPTQITLCGDDYLLVPSLKREGGPASDVKDVVPADEKRSSVSVYVSKPRPTRVAGRKVRRGQSFTARFDVCEDFSASGTGGVPYNTVHTLQPASAVGWSAASGPYDSARCVGITFYSRVGTNTDPSNNLHAAFAYDPGNSSSYSSVAGILTASESSGPLTVSNYINRSSPMSCNESGFLKWSARPQKIIESGLTADLVGSNWFPVTATNAIVGYLKPYVEAGAQTPLLSSFVVYHMEFSYRT